VEPRGHRNPDSNSRGARYHRVRWRRHVSVLGSGEWYGYELPGRSAVGVVELIDAGNCNLRPGPELDRRQHRYGSTQLLAQFGRLDRRRQPPHRAHSGAGHRGPVGLGPAPGSGSAPAQGGLAPAAPTRISRAWSALRGGRSPEIREPFVARCVKAAQSASGDNGASGKQEERTHIAGRR